MSYAAAGVGRFNTLIPVTQCEGVDFDWRNPCSAGFCPGGSDAVFERRTLGPWLDEPDEVREVLQAGVEALERIDPAAEIVSLFVSVGEFSVSRRDIMAEASLFVDSGAGSVEGGRQGQSQSV